MIVEPYIAFDGRFGKFISSPDFSAEIANFLRCTYSIIYTGFSVEGGGPSSVGGPILEGRNEILLLDKALKCKIIFQKYALKLLKFWNSAEKIWE